MGGGATAVGGAGAGAMTAAGDGAPLGVVDNGSGMGKGVVRRPSSRSRASSAIVVRRKRWWVEWERETRTKACVYKIKKDAPSTPIELGADEAKKKHTKGQRHDEICYCLVVFRFVLWVDRDSTSSKPG